MVFYPKNSVIGYLYYQPLAAAGFQFFLDKKLKQKNQGFTQ